MNLTKKELNKISKEQGFVRDTLEKVCRLSDILVFINSHPLMKERLALKGGTAINLTVFHLPRLSVDIDLDYSVDIDRNGMMAEREIITQDLLKYMQMQGYELSDKSRSSHTLNSSIFTYINSAGVKDNIKIEINYSMRIHILPLTHRDVLSDGIFSEATVFAVTGIELFASKIKALLDRAAARDLYDVSNMIRFGLFDDSESELLKKCTLFYMAIGNERVPEKIDVSKIDEITFQKVRTDLLPVKRKSEEFDLLKIRKLVKEYIADLLQLTENEEKFMSYFREGQYCLEYLFDDEVIIERLKTHPMALWKAREISD